MVPGRRERSMSPHLVQSIYAAKRGKWLDPHCSILISLARTRGRAARERLPEYAQNAHGSGSSWRFARRAHQRRLEQGGGGERAEQRQRQELAHARGAGMGGEPEAAERRCRHQRAEQHGARQRRLQKIGFAPAPSGGSSGLPNVWAWAEPAATNAPPAAAAAITSRRERKLVALLAGRTGTPSSAAEFGNLSIVIIPSSVALMAKNASCSCNDVCGRRLPREQPSMYASEGIAALPLLRRLDWTCHEPAPVRRWK
jgi:hypothetical protein